MVLIASALLSRVLRVLKKNKKTRKHVSLCRHVPLVIHKPCGRSLRISRAPFPPPPRRAVNQDGGWGRNEDAKNMGRNDLFPSSCFPAEERYIYPGSRVSACFQMWHVNFITRVSPRRVPRFYGQTTTGMGDGGRQRVEIYLDCIIFKYDTKKKRGIRADERYVKFFIGDHLSALLRLRR